MRIGLAFRAFYAALFQPVKAQKLAAALLDQPQLVDLQPETTAKKQLGHDPEVNKPPKKASHTQRSDALTLLSALQREARFLDLVQEPLDGYSDAQIGAAARDVLRESRKILQRMFAIEPLVTHSEGEKVLLPSNPPANRWRLVGSTASSPTSGNLVHAGWQAKQVELPLWTGSGEDSLVLAPAEVEC